ncbi:uncharacterized protein LOC134185250 isoform X2 [Corticium candelabrum]|uniref:uncharacterized protein LOC134185250 isoform X2 n=1 Tax=Corticium candelabrum TaxID=121492 RepID=UPI002E253E00|nr:uncharacterized protein LOC134185250 isoform X2 [Corticium candelabrum]
MSNKRRARRSERMHTSDDERARIRCRRRRRRNRLFHASLDTGIAQRLAKGSSDGSADTETALDYLENACCGDNSSSGEEMDVAKKLSSLNVNVEDGFSRFHDDWPALCDMKSIPGGVLSESEAISGSVSWRAGRKKRRKCRTTKASEVRFRQKRKLPPSDIALADGVGKKWKKMSPFVSCSLESTDSYTQDDPYFSVLDRGQSENGQFTHSQSATVTQKLSDTETLSIGMFPTLTEKAVAHFACRLRVKNAISISQCPTKSTCLRRRCLDQANSSDDDSVFVNPPSPQPDMSAGSLAMLCSFSNFTLPDVENENLMCSCPDENEMSDGSIEKGRSSSSSSLSDHEQTADEKGRDGDDEESSFEHSARVIPWWDKEMSAAMSSEDDEEFQDLMDSAQSLLITRPCVNSTSYVPQTRHMRVSTECLSRKKGRSLSPPTNLPFCASISRPLPHSNIGNQILRSMGWVPGCGLGARSDGILEPVMPIRRPKGRGLGHS